MRHILAVAVGLIALSAFPSLTHAFEIRNDATGGDCTQIGTWDASTKTCVLTTDLIQTIRISDSDITLDGGGKTLTGDGVYNLEAVINISGSRNTAIRNIVLDKFTRAINASGAENVMLDHIMVSNTEELGLLMQNTNGATISDSTFEFSPIYSSRISYNLNFIHSHFNYVSFMLNGTFGINITDNTFVGEGVSVGEYDSCGSSTITRNTITSGDIGIAGEGANLIADNIVEGSISGAANGDADTMTIARNHVRKPADNDWYYGIGVGRAGFTVVDNEVSGCMGNERRCSNYTLFGVNGGTFSHNRSEGGKIGFDVWNASGVTLTDNTVIGASEAAVSITGQDNAYLVNSDPNIFTANTFRDGAVGIKAVEPYGFPISNIFSKNIFARNTSNTEVSYSNPNFVKLSQPLPDGGNYWDHYDTTAEGCVDSNNDHACDSPYVVQTGDQQLVDQYPLTCPSGTTCTSTKTPVLFIPGLMGTEMSKNGELLWADVPRMRNDIGIFGRGDTFMDPLAMNSDGTPSYSTVITANVISRKKGLLYDFDYTEGLTNEFVSRGYSTSTDFLMFPYDWRKDIASVANNELKAQIDTLLSQTGSTKIDIIAHSQGGLLIKKLLLDHPEYKAKIRKLIFLGTPQLGAPKAAKGLLFGDDYGIGVSVGDRRISFLDPAESKFIAHNMPSGYELLPSLQYFNTVGGYLSSGGALLNTPTQTTQKLKALGLNSTLLDTKTASFHNTLDLYDFTGSGIDVINIVGCNQASVAQIKIGTNHDSSILYTKGDGTVPIASAEGLFGATRTFYATYPDLDHSSMPSFNGIRQTIGVILMGTSTNRTGISESPVACDLSGRVFSVHSPVTLNIYDDAGNHVGPTDDGNFEATIPGSSYDTLGEEKFAFVPEGNYTVKLNATGAGSFSFFSSKVENDETVSTAFYIDIPIASTSKAEIVTNDQNTQTIALDTTGQGTATTTVTPTAVLTGSSTDDVVPPITTLIATGTKGTNNYYTSNVIVMFSATDTATSTEVASGVLKTEYSFDNSTSTVWRVYSTSTSLVATTTTTFYYYSTDRMGNREAVASATILIDTMKPSTPTLTALPTATSTIKLTWATSTDNVAVTQYQLSRATTSTGVLTLIATTTASTTMFTNTGLTASTTYWYEVRAVDLAGNVSSSSNKVSTTTLKVTTDTTPPTIPTNLKATSTTPTQITLTWATSTDNIKVIGYKVERCMGATCTNFIQVTTSTLTSYQNTGLTASTTYRFRVRAYDQAGNNSPYSTIVTATTQKAPQTIFTDTFESPLNWTKVGAVTWYTGTPKVGTHAVKLTTTASIEKAISLATYQNVTVSFRMGANSLDTSSENVQALYYNGTAWVTLTTIANNTTNENNLLNTYTFTLPSTMNNKSTFKLRFKINGSAIDDAAFIDDVKVVGVRM